MCYLGEIRLREARLAHLRGLAHGDVALCQWPLGEGLGGSVLADLTIGSITVTGTLSTGPLPPTTPRFTLHWSTSFIEGEGVGSVCQVIMQLAVIYKSKSK